LRKYIVRVREFFGGGDVMISNDVLTLISPPSEEYDDPYCKFYLPCIVDYTELTDPDYKRHPELKEIKELEGLVW